MNPAYDEENIYVGNLKGELFSLNKNNGKLNWKLETTGIFNATPFITLNKIIQPDLNEKLFLVDKNKGVITKTYYFDGRLSLSPVYYRNKLFIGYDRGILGVYEFVK